MQIFWHNGDITNAKEIWFDGNDIVFIRTNGERDRKARASVVKIVAS